MATTEDVTQAIRDKAMEVLQPKSATTPSPTQPPVAKPAAPAAQKAGTAKPVQAPAPKKPEVVKASEAAKQAMGISSVPQGMMSDTAGLMASQDKELAAHPLPTEPLAKFTPEHLQTFSEFSAVLMVMGALAGRHTMAPATAAMNNLTGVMQGIKQGQNEVYQKQKLEFDENVKQAKENWDRVVEERKQIMDKYKGDLAAQKEADNQWKLYNGISTQLSGQQMQFDKALMVQGEEFNRHLDRLTAVFAGIDRQATPKPGGSGASGTGNKTGDRMLRVQSMDVNGAAYDIKELMDMSNQRGEMVGGSAAFANTFSGTTEADLSRYMKTGVIDTQLQGADALLLNLAFDIASGQSGGSGQLAQAKIKEIENQMPLESEPAETKATKWRALINRVQNINRELPKEKQVDLSKYQQWADKTKTSSGGGAHPEDINSLLNKYGR